MSRIELAAWGAIVGGIALAVAAKLTGIVWLTGVGWTLIGAVLAVELFYLVRIIHRYWTRKCRRSA